MHIIRNNLYKIVCLFILVSGVQISAAKYGIFLHSDHGLSEGMEKSRRKQFHQVGKYLDALLIERLDDGGFKMKRLKNREDFLPRPKWFYLYVTIKEYERKGSTPFFLEVKYMLSEDGDTPLLENNFQIESVRAWQKCTEKAAKLIADEIIKNRRDLDTARATRVVTGKKSSDQNEEINEQEEVRPGEAFGENSATLENQPGNLKKEEMDPKSRLERLKELFDTGMISEEEYNKKKEEILSTL